MRDKADKMTAIHSAELGYAPTTAYGGDQNSGRSMKIVPSEKARDKREHPFVRTHHETGNWLCTIEAYIQGFTDIEKAESDALLIEFYGHQTDDAFIYSHKWEKDML